MITSKDPGPRLLFTSRKPFSISKFALSSTEVADRVPAIIITTSETIFNGFLHRDFMVKVDSTSGCKYLVPPNECKVHILMGSKSDLPIAKKAVRVFEELNVPFSLTVASAHRTPDLVEDTVKGSAARVFIAIAGLSAALPGVVASHTHMPVIGVDRKSVV